MTTHFPPIAILGTGSMGGAILAGILASGAETDSIAVTNRTEAKAFALKSARVNSLSTEVDPDANRAALTGARLVIVAVKPAMVLELLREVRDALEPDALIVSVAAGVTIDDMEELVPQAVFRSVPNTPASVRGGVTGLTSGSRATVEETALVRALFETVGVVIEVPEEKINALSSISGSGPAYVFYLMEQLTDAAKDLGFDEQQARLMVEQTFQGAAEMLASGDGTPEELRQQVKTPKGSTERAIAVLESGDLKSVVDRATASAIERAEGMAKGR